MRLFLVAFGMALASPAFAADQFDLVCRFGATPVRYRVDVQRGEACENECSRVWKMGSISDSELRLIDTIVNYPEERPETMTVNRRTGELVHWIGGIGRPIVETASCAPAEFSGFPDRQF